MKVTDGIGRTWEVRRRFAPWDQVISLRPRLREVMPQKKDSDDDADTPWYLWPALVVLYAYAVLEMLAMCIFGAPFALLELVFRGIAGAAWWVARSWLGALSQVEIRYEDDRGPRSISVLTVPGHAAAGALADDLTTYLRGLTEPFSPQSSPSLKVLLSSRSARVRSHLSSLT